MADENGLSVLGGYPGALRKVLGIWAEELDTLYEQDVNHIVTREGAAYGVNTFCDLIHTETAETLATYQSDFYAGRPAVTRNAFGKGVAYYIAARTGGDFIDYFYADVVKELALKRNMETALPTGVTVQRRTDGAFDYLFVMNFSEEGKKVETDGAYTDMLSGEAVSGTLVLDVYGVRVLKRPSAVGIV
jgi:beta-galactosidase